jgi:hypothetical protein
MAATQHGSNTTWQQHNIVAAQNIVKTFQLVWLKKKHIF